jgi:malate dehydrogenase (oxaloacetate-decarboxylating)
MYIGNRHARVRDQRNDDLIDAYVTVAAKLFPHAMLHWEGLRCEQYANSQQVRRSACTFNDDMRGTAAVVIAAAFAAVNAAGSHMRDQRVVIHGAGARVWASPI